MSERWRMGSMTRRSVMIVVAMAFLAIPVTRSAEAQCVGPAQQDVPFKIVNIRNNWDKPIWAVLESAKQDIVDPDTKKPHDRWLQAEFKPTPGTYASSYLYRAYVNPIGGIPKQSTVSVKVPFYT